MRTTVDLNDELFRRIKSVAALRGETLKQFITRSVERRLEQMDPQTPQSRPVKLPLVRSKRPGTLNITPEMIDEAMWE